MKIPNYEVAISTMEQDDGSLAPILALSFAWEDLGKDQPESWDSQRCGLKITSRGLRVTLNDQVLLFPLSVGDDPEKGVNRDQMLGLIKSHGHLFVCGFDQQGDMVASIGFTSAE